MAKKWSDLSADGQWVVSTVELPASRVIDEFLNPEWLPDSHETMIFAAGPGGEVSSWADRYRRGYADAPAAAWGHQETVVALNAGLLELN